MKIIEPSFELFVHGEPLTPFRGIRMLEWIERNARISHRSEDKQATGSWQKFIPTVVMEHGDMSVVEHASLTAIIRVDRGITHELVRHRLFSFTQESTRFVNGRKFYPEGLEFIEPIIFTDAPNLKSASWMQAMKVSEDAYFDLLEHGARPQEARSVLPNSLAATISVTGNLRNWRHFFLMRTSRETHPDFRRVTIPMLAEFKRCIPILFNDIEPNMRQIDNLKKAR